ncbi:nicotinate-nucleotide adenylyltransferase [Pleionea sp. CnH1-48]|uniref:nicotinate-nucleotide adenylyltransferase n=1 Tax=Pleionea sp. CnH1-48 TaxID=2954494 RepID=UPI0020978B91|nr:nicotinate-nucleotide adenylyltransferase [Pleionea sp. CnH1-48]MCO7227383.1 nicotinate-nucleotide adenylyltransferase [Pleionea sp. CnH1-48]
MAQDIVSIVAQKPLLIFGGTFDPIHFGHLRLVENLKNLLPDADILLVPSAEPPHRDSPGASSQQRLAMLKLAVEGVDRVQIDDRELRRSGPSYSILTMQELRAEYPLRPILWIMGSDAAAHLHRWHRWQEIAQSASVLIVARPGTEREAMPEVLAQDFNWCETLSELAVNANGQIGWQQCPLLDISATQIRTLLKQNQSIRFLLPQSVIKYIEEQRLYQE